MAFWNGFKKKSREHTACVSYTNITGRIAQRDGYRVLLRPSGFVNLSLRFSRPAQGIMTFQIKIPTGTFHTTIYNTQKTLFFNGQKFEKIIYARLVYYFYPLISNFMQKCLYYVIITSYIKIVLTMHSVFYNNKFLDFSRFDNIKDFMFYALPIFSAPR